ncbi:hypothetical protein FO519_009624 [Halicephalobus sp. NKZ332]|nr:hypothetical protein FO519_009624 [Halicephalobus sp. NKZ332]
MNRLDKVQVIDAYNKHNNIAYDWNEEDSTALVQSILIDQQYTDVIFSLNTTLRKLSSIYFVAIPTTASYENYGGADDVAQKLKDAGFQLTFLLVGPDVDESKLTNYTNNFVHWRNMSNPQPENWDKIRFRAYGCDPDDII